MRIARSRSMLARLALTASAALLAASCSGSSSPSPAEASPARRIARRRPPPPTSSASTSRTTRTSRLSARASRVTATGLPAGKEAELQWGTVTGGWVIEDYYHFRGKKYTDSTMSLGRFPDRSGRPAQRAVHHSRRLRRRPRRDGDRRWPDRRAERHRRHPELRDLCRRRDRSALPSNCESRGSAGGRWRARGW